MRLLFSAWRGGERGGEEGGGGGVSGDFVRVAIIFMSSPLGFAAF